MELLGLIGELGQSPVTLYLGVLAALWQVLHMYQKHKLDKQMFQHQREMEVLRQKNEQIKWTEQREMELLRQNHEERRWTEQLNVQLAQKHLEVRLEEYPPLWALTQHVSRHYQETGTLTRETCRDLSDQVEAWRYSKAGLLANKVTREAAFRLQVDLWEYDGSEHAFNRIRDARQQVRDALRADMGLGKNWRGQNIYSEAISRQTEEESSEPALITRGSTGHVTPITAREEKPPIALTASS